MTLALEKNASKGLIMQNTELEGPMYLTKEHVAEDADHGRLSDMNGCPCFHCIKISRCGVRQADSPVVCRKLEEWMLGTNSV